MVTANSLPLGSTTRAVRSPSTTSPRAPRFVEMQGRPAAIAACNAVPRPSNSEGNANASRAACTCPTSLTNPGKNTASVCPRRLVSASNSVRQAPSPASSSRTSGCNARTRGSASIKCRCPFSGTNTLAQPNKNSFSRTPQCFRALLRCSGVRNGKISTPSFTMEIRSAAIPESIRRCATSLLFATNRSTAR